MIPELNDDILYFSVQSDRMVEAGQRYFQQGRVSNLVVDSETDMVSALVRGSARSQYFTSVIFDDDDEYGGLPASECTCPVGTACKHVAALLFALAASADAGPSTEKPRLRIEARQHDALGIAGPLARWLDNATLESLALRVKPDEIRFTLESADLFKIGKHPAKGMPSPALPERYTLQVNAWRRRVNETQWRHAHPWEVQNAGPLLNPDATRLLSRLTHTAGGDFTAQRSPKGPHGWHWLREASVAGILHWQNPDGARVTVEREHFEATLCWRTLDDGRQVVDLDCEQYDPASHMIFAGDPPTLFEIETGRLRLINAGAPALVGRILAMPPVAAHEISALVARWSEIAHDVLPAPQLTAAVPLARIAPRPVLRCVIDKVAMPSNGWDWRARASSRTLEIARLEFDYDGHRVGAMDTASEVIASGPDGIIRIIRDIQAEQAAADRLSRTSLTALALSQRYDTKPIQGWDHAFPEEDYEHDQRFREFLVNDALALREEGWIIEFAPKWPHVLLEADGAMFEAPGIEIAPAAAPIAKGETIDWFDVELPARVEGDKRIDVLPALRRLMASDAERLLACHDEYTIALPLGDGRFTALRLGTIRPLIEAIMRLALADHAATTLKISRFDLGTVHDLAISGVPWASKDSLRVLAARLSAPEDQSFVPPENLNATLRAYQACGCTWLSALHEAGLGGILADDMGLGKTLQAIAHVLTVRSKAPHDLRPVLIVAPTSVLPNWQAEIERFAPQLTCLLWHGSDRRHVHGNDFSGTDIVLTSYTLLGRDSALLSAQPLLLVILDEAHVLKNPKTAGFKAAASLETGQLVALTGTPVENRLTDLWSLASLTNPGILGSYESFGKSYRTPIEKQGDRVARAALTRRIRPFMLRRTKDAVAADLPAKTIIPERIELAPPQLRLYESQRLLMHKRVREEIDRVGLMRSQIIVLDAMLKLRQICCDPALLPGKMGEGIASSKRERLLEMIPELVAEGRRIIVFSQFTTMLDLIAGDLDRLGLLYDQLRGSTRDRARPVRRFQEGEVPIILVSLKAGGAGVNLTAADTVILYDPWWNPAVEAQAIDRAHRLGQLKPVFVHRLIATGTIEEKILDLQRRKQGLADMLWDATAKTSAASLTNADIEFLLG